MIRLGSYSNYNEQKKHKKQNKTTPPKKKNWMIGKGRFVAFSQKAHKEP